MFLGARYLYVICVSWHFLHEAVADISAPGRYPEITLLDINYRQSPNFGNNKRRLKVSFKGGKCKNFVRENGNIGYIALS